MSGRFSQLVLDFPCRTALGRADFLISPSNQDAVGWLDRWPRWPMAGLVLHGPAGCGKTHLLHLWQARSAGTILPAAAVTDAAALADWPQPPALAVDDADQAPEEALLHLYNRCRETGGTMLVAARRAPSAWPIALADLASRLRALVAIGIGAPDEALLGAVIIKHFADRQFRVPPEVIAYLVPRMERSLAAAAAIAFRLDALALAAGGPATVPLARLALAEQEAQSSRDDPVVT